MKRILPALLLVFLTSCGDDGVITDPPPGPEPYPEALVSMGEAGMDQLVANLELAYEQLFFEEYEKLISPDFVFKFDPSEIDIVGATEMSAFADLSSTLAMFTGEYGLEAIIDPVTGLPTGEFDPVAPVQSVRIALIPDLTSNWTSMNNGEFAGAWRRIYDLDMTVTYAGDKRIDQVRGKQVLYVTEGTLPDDTSGVLHWQLRGWEDQGIDSGAYHGTSAQPVAGSNSGSLGQIKAQFGR